uniref:Hydrogenase-4 component E n=1 Tax=Streptomyces sp. NBC_00003 TaxID=2903608 RepID=A0AAU2V1T2_9ACTN
MLSDTLFTKLLDLCCGAFLLAAVVMLWRRELAAEVRVFALQGVALAGIAALLGLHETRWDLVSVAVGIGLLRAGALPYLLRRALAGSGAPEETQPLVNGAGSLLTAAALTLLAYVVARPLVALNPNPVTRALPVGLAVVLIGFFVLATRRHAAAQVIGFLLLDNGITAIAFLAASGVPLIVELGVSFDLLLAVLVLHILTARMRDVFGSAARIDDLQELHD